MQPVDRLGGDVDGGVKTEGHIRPADVVIDRFWNTHNVDPALVKLVGDVQRSIPPDKDNGVNIEKLDPLDELVGDIFNDFLAVLLRLAFEWVPAAGSAQDRSAKRENAAHLTV